LPSQLGSLGILYDATGRKWRKAGPSSTTLYSNGIEYRDGKLEAIYLPDGRLAAEYAGSSITRYRAEYFHQDHLGNTRLAFSDFNQDNSISLYDDPATPESELEITLEAHYYPFGMGHLGPWYESVAPENKYLYNGKELNDEEGVGLYDYGARWYDAALGRWGQVDPLAEEYYSFTPFGYTVNNPIVFSDPDGMHVEPSISKDEDGQNVVTIRITGKIINLSGSWFANPQRLAGRLDRLGKSLSGQATDVSGLGLTDSDGQSINEAILNFEFNFEPIDRLSSVAYDDHLIVLADFMPSQLANGVTSADGGKLIYIDVAATVGPIDMPSGYGTVVAGHEIVSHALGAGHHGNSLYITHGQGVHSYSRKIREAERKRMVANAYTEGRLNRGPTLATYSNHRVPLGYVFTASGQIPVRQAGVKYNSVLRNAMNKQ
jgi:RHS repeat-associated protein